MYRLTKNNYADLSAAIIKNAFDDLLDKKEYQRFLNFVYNPKYKGTYKRSNASVKLMDHHEAVAFFESSEYLLYSGECDPGKIYEKYKKLIE